MVLETHTQACPGESGQRKHGEPSHCCRTQVLPGQRFPLSLQVFPGVEAQGGGHNLLMPTWLLSGGAEVETESMPTPQSSTLFWKQLLSPGGQARARPTPECWPYSMDDRPRASLHQRKGDPARPPSPSHPSPAGHDEGVSSEQQLTTHTEPGRSACWWNAGMFARGPETQKLSAKAHPSPAQNDSGGQPEAPGKVTHPKG